MTIWPDMACDDMQCSEIAGIAQRPKLHAALRGAAVAAGLVLSMALPVLLIAPAAVAIEPIACDSTMRAQQVAQLLFGRNVADQIRVTEVEWSDFVAREVSPRFPDGFTVLDATGQWRDSRRGTIIHEGSKLIEIVLPGRSDDKPKIDAIAEAYKNRFEQQSVGLIIGPACIRF
jgi:uncharacterized protein DUF3574